MEKFTVSLDELVKFLLKKWKIIIIGIIGFSIFSAVSAVSIGGKIVIPPDENYGELKMEEASFMEYIENSPVMSMDATSIYRSVVYVSDIKERALLKDFVESGAVWNEWEDVNFKTYFDDLVTWHDINESSAEIEIYHYEENVCSNVSKFLSIHLLNFDTNLKVLQGETHVTSDETIADVQEWYRNRLNAIEGQLEHTAAGYTIEVSVLAAIITGGIFGVFFTVAILFAVFWVQSQKQYKQ